MKSSAKSPGPTRRVLLAVGTKTYRHGADFAEPLADLDRVPDSLRMMVEALTALGYAPELEAARGYLLNPSMQQLRDAIRAAAESASVLVVYLTGHGIKPDGSLYYLLTEESRPSRLIETALEARQLLQLVLRSNAYGESARDDEQPQVLVILDCCFSGSGGMEALKESLQAIGNPNVWFLASASSVEYSQEGVHSRGAETWRLADGGEWR